jgi:hypothetical protein
MGEETNACRFLMGNPERKTSLRKLRRNWENNIKTDVKVIRWGFMNWIDLAQDRDQWRVLVNTVTDLLVL